MAKWGHFYISSFNHVDIVWPVAYQYHDLFMRARQQLPPCVNDSQFWLRTVQIGLSGELAMMIDHHLARHEEKHVSIVAKALVSIYGKSKVFQNCTLIWFRYWDIGGQFILYSYPHYKKHLLTAIKIEYQFMVIWHKNATFPSLTDRARRNFYSLLNSPISIYMYAVFILHMNFICRI